MKSTILTIAILALITVTFNACKKDKKTEPAVDAPAPPQNESELITTLKLLLRDSTAHTSTTILFSDSDGPGGNPAIYGGTNQSDSVITLLANHIYKCDILLLDQTKNPTDSISNEVKEEGVDHLFFFNSIAPTGNPYSVYLSGSATTIKYLDLDANNRGIGLSTLITAPTVAQAKAPLKIMLKHQPNVKDGTFAPGETDIEVNFKLKIN